MLQEAESHYSRQRVKKVFVLFLLKQMCMDQSVWQRLWPQYAILKPDHHSVNKKGEKFKVLTIVCQQLFATKLLLVSLMGMLSL